MRPDEGLLARVVKVVPHQEVEQLGSVGPDGAQFGVTALEHLVAQGGAHVCSPLVERGGELEQSTGPADRRGQHSQRSSAPGRRRETGNHQYNCGLKATYLIN